MKAAGWGAKGRWLALGVAGLIALLNFSLVSTTQLAEHGRARLKEPFVDEVTGVLTMLLLLPAVLLFLRRFPLTRAGLWRRLPLHAAAFLLFAATHTLLMWGSRTAIWSLLEWGRYDYGLMRWRFVMEGQKQLVAWLLITAVEGAVQAARRSRERAVRAEQLERELTEARLAALKMQLQPHFLFNTLHMIAGRVREDPAVAEEMIGHLSDFLRLTLRNASRSEVPLGTELDFLEAYLAIMKARFEEKLAVEVDAPAELRRALVPHLVFQPLVENALEHCTAVHGRPGTLRIRVARAGERLTLAVSDNGPGLGGTSAAEALRAGVGLSNTQGRLRSLYGAAHRLELLETEGGGLTVLIEIPAREEAAA